MRKIVCTVINDTVYDQRMHRICSSLVRAGYQVELVGRCYDNSPAPRTDVNYQITRLNCKNRSGKLFYIEFNLRLFRYLMNRRADIYYSVDLDTLLPNTIVSLLRGKPRVYDAHEYFTEIPELEGRQLTKFIWRLIARLSIPRQNLCYTVSHTLAEQFSKRYHKNFFVIRNVPLPTENILTTNAVTTSFHKPFILYQGALNLGRGLPELIEAMKSLPQQIHLYIAGEGDLSTELRKKVEVDNLKDKIHFLGWCAPTYLAEITAHAWLGYNILANMGQSYYYSLSNKFFDYMLAKVPSLNSDFPEYKYHNTRYGLGYLVPDLNSDTLVTSINKLRTDVELYQQLVKNCTIATPDCTWPAEENKLIKLFESI